MSVTPLNTTGWSQLMDGNLIGAAYAMYNAAFVGWFVFSLFLVYQFMLYLKTKNIVLNFITSIIFGSMFISANLITGAAIPIMYFLFVMLLGGILFMWFMK